MNPFKNFVVSLQATGTSAVVCVWLICITLIALLAPDSATTKSIITIMSFFGGVLMVAMAFRKE